MWIYLFYFIVIPLFTIVLSAWVVRALRLSYAPYVFLAAALSVAGATIWEHDRLNEEGMREARASYAWGPHVGGPKRLSPGSLPLNFGEPPWDDWVLKDSIIRVTPHELGPVTGNLFWRFLRWGIIEGDNTEKGRVLMSDWGVAPGLRPYLFNPYNPTPGWIVVWLLLLLFLSFVKPTPKQERNSQRKLRGQQS
jgi:hypothetical protein